MKLVYFAWIRERIGRPEERVDLPASVKTVGDLLDWLKSRGEEYRNALGEDGIVRVAIDHHHIENRDAPIAGAGEIALFPPMTGG